MPFDHLTRRQNQIKFQEKGSFINFFFRRKKSKLNQPRNIVFLSHCLFSSHFDQRRNERTKGLLTALTRAGMGLNFSSLEPYQDFNFEPTEPENNVDEHFKLDISQDFLVTWFL